MDAGSGSTFDTRAIARKAGRSMLIAACAVLALLMVLAGALLLLSPGKPMPFLDEHGNRLAGSISEKIHVNINGVEQGMFIRSMDETHPVLLYLHGGMPEYFLAEIYPTGLEEDFTVVWWEQRGSGISFNPGDPPETMTLEPLVSDTIAVTNYLRGRFDQDKIYLMGHSGGSFVGIHAAAQAPQLYHAYIGVAQMSSQLRSEQLAYEYMLQRFRADGNTGMVRRLEAAPVSTTDGTPDAYLALRDQAMHSLGIGTTREMKSVITGIFLPSLTSQAYTLPEKLNMWRGKSRSGVALLWDDMLNTDLAQELPELKIPVYFVHGAHDYTVSYTEARFYFERLTAPLKAFYTFEDSAHSPLFEEPTRMQTIMREDVLTGRDRLADSR